MLQEGEIQEHPGDFNAYRVGSEEKRALDRVNADTYDKVRKYAENLHAKCR
jgi:methionyl aminopeptidase